MAKTKISKKVVPSSDDIAWNFKKDETITPHNTKSVASKPANIIQGIMECIELNKPNDVVTILGMHLYASGKKKLPKNPDAPILAPATAKVVLAGIKAIIKILQPAEEVIKKVRKPAPKAVAKKRRVPLPAPGSQRRAAIRLSGKKRSSKKRAV